MKQVTSMARLTGQLERMFRAINQDFFDGELDTPIITVTPTARAYAHYTPWNAWTSKEEHKKEINISSAYLDRPMEYICASLLHEAVHMYTDTILNQSDTSRGGAYHNALFKQAAEAHGLICTKTGNGWSDTSSTLSDKLMDWVLLHDEFREIELCRTTPGVAVVGTGLRSVDRGTVYTGTGKNNSRRYVCPCCRTIIRATRSVNVLCGDCMTAMIES